MTLTSLLPSQFLVEFHLLCTLSFPVFLSDPPPLPMAPPNNLTIPLCPHLPVAPLGGAYSLVPHIF